MKYLWGSCLSTLTLLAPAAYAQEESAGSPLQEIIVTAQKRSENVQNVPIAVTSIAAGDLANARVADTQGLQLEVPSLNYASNAGFAQPFLRGVGSDIGSPGAEASVATFIDGVYIVNNQSVITNLLGIDRVEVLAGPQGTLYGRNASGGAINIYTMTPKQELEASASVTGGNYDLFEGSAHVSGGVSDTLAIGVYAIGTQRHTYLNYAPALPPGQRTKNKAWAARFKAVWQPVDAVKLTGSIEHSYDYNVEASYRNVQPNAIGNTLGGTPIIKDYVVVSDIPQFRRATATTGILREEVDLGFADLVGITGYRKGKSIVQANLDGTDTPVAYVNSPIRSRQFSQEAQLVSKPGSPIKWIAGAYYLKEKSGYLPLSVRSGVLLPAPLIGYDFFSPIQTRSFAVFAQGSAPLTDRLTLTLGARYTWDRKAKGAGRQDLLLPDGTVAASIPYPAASRNWEKFTPKIGLEYKLDNALLYATYSQGYKSGLFTTSSADNTPVNPETLDSWEAGVKSDLFGRRLRFNASAYYYKFKDLQVAIFEGGAAQSYRNAARARAYGIDLSVLAALTEKTTLKLGAAVEHSEYKDFPEAAFFILSPTGNINSSRPADGNPLMRAPKFVGTAELNQKIPLKDGSSFDLTASLYHNSGFNWDPAGDLRQGSYRNVNLSATYTTADKNWKLTAWVTNLFDKQRFVTESFTNFGTFAADDAPRMYGVTASWDM
ncbi:TonB-dependent receptor [Novosphingobium aquimarinum]|uniref:TonB-dependent receptor n=1 Tax=Novosphingobium aquimarinum TaxID=2682494 RepID=UPI0012EB1992|nr:TonB-dependent receptor [Novosphingobium aquimarinum]